MEWYFMFFLQNGRLLCGGAFSWETMWTCLTLSEAGVWSYSHNLLYKRSYHVSWETREGVMLIGQ